jgi:hypothetical protein
MASLVDTGPDLFAVLIALASAGCNGLECSPPPSVSYSCSSTDASSDACRGGPPLGLFGGDAGQDHPDLMFPIGCEAAMPFCNPYYGDVQACTCDEPHVDGGVPEWVCPV